MSRILLVASLLLAVSPAFACTQDELQAKAVSLGQLADKITAKDPSKANDWKKKQIDAANVAGQTTDLDTICAAYDKVIAEAQASQ